MLLTEVATEVVRSFLKYKYHPSDFKTFIQQHSHIIYHLHNNSRCCSCGLATNFPRQQVIKKCQFDKLLLKHGQNCSRSRFCSCGYIAAANIQLDDNDITLCITLINNCYGNSLSQQDDTSLQDTRQVRNEVAHFSHNADISDNELYTMMGKVKNGVIHLAGCIDKNYCTEIQERISRIESRPYLAIDYLDVLRQLLQWQLENEEVGIVCGLGRCTVYPHRTHPHQLFKIRIYTFIPFFIF